MHSFASDSKKIAPPPHRSEASRRIRLFLYLAVFAVTLLSLALFIVSKTLIDCFGPSTAAQLLFHLQVGVDEGGLTGAQIKIILKNLSILLAGAAAFSILFYGAWHCATPAELIRWLWHHAIRLGKHFLALRIFTVGPVVWVCIASLVLSFAAVKTVNRRHQVSDYLRQEESTWFAEHYARLDTTSIEHKDGRARNLIFVSLESIEDGYSDASVYGSNLIAELTLLKREGISFSGYQRGLGSRYTMDGLCSQLAGVPLEGAGMFELHGSRKTNNYASLLKNAPSFLNLLTENGYQSAFFVGSSGEFTQKASFFKTHGIDPNHIYVRETFEQKGFALAGDNKGSNWGYADAFVWKRVKSWLTEHAAADKPFVAVVETLDTHAPEGYVKPEDYRWGDARDSIRASSRMAGEFVAWAKRQPWYADTTIVLVGDHPWQDSANSFTERFTRSSNNRAAFNVILNPSPAARERALSVQGRNFLPMDMAPTVLDCMGVAYRSIDSNGTPHRDQLGLGISILSDRKNYVETLGVGKLIETMRKKSSAYEALF